LAIREYTECCNAYFIKYLQFNRIVLGVPLPIRCCARSHRRFGKGKSGNRSFVQYPIHRPIGCGPGKKRAKALLSGANFRFAPPAWRNRRFHWEELVMADINATVSKFLEQFSQILEKPSRALALGAGVTFLLLLLYHVTNLGGGYFGAFFTFLHVVSGITWIGLLYYFNLVQIPTMPKIPSELKPAIGEYILPEALLWFRWSALATVVTGLIVFFTSSAVRNL